MDLQTFNLINQFAGRYGWLDKFAVFFAEPAVFILGFLVLMLWFMDYGKKRLKNQYAVVMAFESLILSWLILAPLIGMIFPRLRPFVAYDANLLIQENPLDPSFPSGHATASFALALPVLIYNKRAGIWLTLIAVLISVSRVFVGVHYPLDVLGGIVLSLFVVLVINYFRKTLVAPVVNLIKKK